MKYLKFNEWKSIFKNASDFPEDDPRFWKLSQLRPLVVSSSGNFENVNNLFIR